MRSALSLTTSAMTASSDNRGPHPKNVCDEPAGLLRTLWPWLIALWIATVLVTFFIVRILGSNTGKRILDSLWHSHN
jgi:hypothetical protein